MFTARIISISRNTPVARIGSGTFAQYILKPDWLLPPIPEGVSYVHATMAIDGIGASFGAFQAIDIGASDILLITGLGPVGLGAVVNACFRGTRVIGVEPVPWRRERALQMGAEVVFDPAEPDLVEKIRGLTGRPRRDLRFGLLGKNAIPTALHRRSPAERPGCFCRRIQ